MFIWTAINVDENYDYIKSNISCVERKYAYKYSCLSLPLHVSLKISFEISDDKFEYVQNDLTEILRAEQPFLLTPKYIEQGENTVWIRYEENEKLIELKSQIDRMLLEKYDVPMHEYDKNFIFHTTLFIDDDNDKNAKVFDEVKSLRLPQSLTADRFVIGKSQTGKVGTYSVFKTI